MFNERDICNQNRATLPFTAAESKLALGSLSTLQGAIVQLLGKGGEKGRGQGREEGNEGREGETKEGREGGRERERGGEREGGKEGEREREETEEKGGEKERGKIDSILIQSS